MAKALTILGMLVAVIFLLVFVLDMALGLPFGAGNPARWIMDTGFVICAAILGYLSWTTYREQV